MISDYLKNYSKYYLSRYSVTKKKFENIIKKKITKDFLEKKINEDTFSDFTNEIPIVIKYFENIGLFNEQRLIEITFENYVKKGYSKKKIKFHIFKAMFDNILVKNFLEKKLNDKDLESTLIENYLKKSKILEKKKKLNISDKQLFDKIMYKLSYQGFDYEESKKILNKIISDGNFF